jgi:hypothetical protein
MCCSYSKLPRLPHTLPGLHYHLPHFNQPDVKGDHLPHSNQPDVKGDQRVCVCYVGVLNRMRMAFFIAATPPAKDKAARV